ncbi:transcriptional regulator [Citrobacter amalonaticus]|uniref:Transcriptional regulator n=2 Tax=Citrobacter amalonaticus TaxID=35703 RepID=A0A2S4RZJ7_CITAM|nr:transcriptional regulator [Citrobacter amalonaticus]POT76393.1 transcriptional regulator [Citrobacter amalonaticus]POU66608.1 transcriptional regulator [Citrobacter amalonaticus]POV05628.1 transcriptional regulator [Citrobacter amalonaticus]
MEYLISSQVKYRSDDGAMWPVRDEDSVIILTITMNRLLAYLLERRGQVVTRDELLNNVWDSHGLRSSNHTLNKYISEIRKHLVSSGIKEECVTTVPRIGFMFSSEVDVRGLTDKRLGQEPSTDYINTESGKALQRLAAGAKYKATFITLALMLIAASVTLIIAGIHLPTPKTEKPQDIQTYFLFDYKTCPVYTIQKNSVSLSEQKRKMFLELVESNNIDCLKGTSFLYQVSESYLYGNKGRAFISRCTAKNNKYISCLNNYWSGYESSQ